MSERVLKEEERIAFALRALYKKYGYLPYKMNKFETYDLYVANKEFLLGDGVITFNDTDGKLLALKPDVTLSIIKNDVDDGAKRKVCYHENVYRISEKTKHFKEIMQVGLECIGDVDGYDVFESVYLAAGSLAEISSHFVLDISHLGVLKAIFEDMAQGADFNRLIMQKIAEKNAHEVQEICSARGIDEKKTQTLCALIGIYGEPEKVLGQLKAICPDGAKNAIEELQMLWALLKTTAYADRIRFDFSVVNAMDYYSDIVFKGFIDGIGEGVLSGGRYDRLLEKMGRKSGGIGFAVNLDVLEGFGVEKSVKDVDVLVLYDEDTDILAVANETRRLVQEGYSVTAQKTAGKLRFEKMIDLTGGAK